MYFIPSIHTTLHTEFEENQSSSLRDIFLLRTDLKIALSQEKQPSHGSISFKFGTPVRHIVTYLNLKFIDV